MKEMKEVPETEQKKDIERIISNPLKGEKLNKDVSTSASHGG